VGYGFRILGDGSWITDCEFQPSDFGWQVCSFGFRFAGFRSRVFEFGYRGQRCQASGFWFRRFGFEFRVSGSEFLFLLSPPPLFKFIAYHLQVSCFVFRASGFRFRVSGCEFRPSPPPFSSVPVSCQFRAAISPSEPPNGEQDCHPPPNEPYD